MAGDADVIKEFLVAIGFKLDERQLTKFAGMMGTIGKQVMGFALTMAAAATATEAFVLRISDKLENLYWMSQRVRSGVGAIQDFALGIQNLGGTAEGAYSSMENLAQLLRTNPGYAGLLGRLGVNPNAGSVNIMEQLKTRFQHMPYFIAEKYAEMFGIDERTLLAMYRSKGPIGGGPGGGVYSQLYAAGGIDANKAAEGAKNFRIQVRELEGEFSVTADVLETQLLPIARVMTEWTGTGLKVFLGVVKEINTELTTGSGPLGEFSTIIKGIIGTLEAALVPLGDWLERHHLVQQVGHAAGVAGQAGLDTAKGVFKGRLPGGMAFRGPKPGEHISWKMNDFMQAAGPIINWFQKQGWSLQQAAGFVASTMGEDYNFNPDLWGDQHTAYGIGQWHKDRRAQFAKLFGHSMIGSSLQEQLAFQQWELTHSEAHAGRLLKTAQTAAQAAAITTRAYFRPLNVERDVAYRSGLASKLITIHQKTDIHVQGGASAHDTGKSVAKLQDRVNGDLVRNLKPVVQ